MAARSLTKLKLPRLPKKRPEDHGYLIVGESLFSPQTGVLHYRCQLNTVVFMIVTLNKDPAIERWGKMRETTHLSFKLTPKTVFLGILWGVLVPGSFYYLLKWDLHKQDAKAGRLPREFP